MSNILPFARSWALRARHRRNPGTERDEGPFWRHSPRSTACQWVTLSSNLTSALPSVASPQREAQQSLPAPGSHESAFRPWICLSATTDGIIQYVALGVWLLSLNVASPRLVRAAARGGASSLRMAEWPSIAQMDHVVFVHPSVCGRFGDWH